MELLRIENLGKTYRSREGDVTALEDISLSIEKGDIFGIIGLSGAGKSTLVRCINMLERPTSGSIRFFDEDGGHDITKLKGKYLRNYRKKVSMIFQSFNLFQQSRVLDNVLFPMKLGGKGRLVPSETREGKEKLSWKARKERNLERARELLGLVEMAEKENVYPSQLSGGQQQRVAIARALALQPDILLSDEATSALDPATTKSILALLKKLNRELGLTIVLITHQMQTIEAICNKVAIIDKSHIAEQGTVEEIFSHPKSAIARKLLYSDRINTKLSADKTIRLIFDGTSDEPVVAEMIEECHTLVNILFADTKIIEGKVYGQMVLQLPYYEEDIQTIKEFLNRKQVSYQEVQE